MTIQTQQTARNLRNLYFTRTVVQLAWAITVITTAVENPAVGATLLVLYPLWDVACTLYDLKTSGSDFPRSQYVNAAAGVITAVGIGLTASSHPQYAVAIFGGWAFLAGLLQLVAGALRRRHMGGQWTMILSGAQSLIAGVIFVLGGLGGKFHIKDLGGYAVFGAIYFLVGAILLNRRQSQLLSQ